MVQKVDTRLKFTAKLFRPFLYIEQCVNGAKT